MVTDFVVALVVIDDDMADEGVVDDGVADDDVADDDVVQDASSRIATIKKLKYNQMTLFFTFYLHVY